MTGNQSAKGLLLFEVLYALIYGIATQIIWVK